MNPTDKELDCSIARMLLVGVVASSCLVLAGAALYLRSPFRPMPSYRHFASAGAPLTTLGGIWHGALALDARSWMQFGLLLLIATPVARVAFCIAGFARQRDRLYTGISAFVFAILIYSLLHR